LPGERTQEMERVRVRAARKEQTRAVRFLLRVVHLSQIRALRIPERKVMALGMETHRETTMGVDRRDRRLNLRIVRRSGRGNII